MPFLYLRSTTSEELNGLPFLLHVTWGSGSPITIHDNVSVSPSVIFKSFSSFENVGAHMFESSGGTTSNKICNFC